MRPRQAGSDVKAIVTGQSDLFVSKRVNSCFHGAPDLDGWLRGQDLDGVVLAGMTTHHCRETTARVGGDLDHQVLFALGATRAFDRTGPDGQVVSAGDLAQVTATNVHGESATVVATHQLLPAS